MLGVFYVLRDSLLIETASIDWGYDFSRCLFSFYVIGLLIFFWFFLRNDFLWELDSLY
jgi:hypothetical protein